MNKKQLLTLWCVVLLAALACNFVTGLIPQEPVPAEKATAPVNAASDGFFAEVSEDSVSFIWDAARGAEHYLIELQIGDEFIPLVLLPSDQLIYIDRIPGGAQYTYRLTSLGGTEDGKSKTLTVSVPQSQSEPQAVTITFDQNPAAIDMNQLDPSQFDPNTFDPSLFMPQPIQAEARIGPQGGELSVTGLNGMTYVLTVPAGALDFETTLRLKPISEIADLPLSGGILGALLIEPESIVFDLPATLEMIPPPGFSLPAASLQLGFAFDGSGKEFHLYPLAVERAQSFRALPLADLSPVPRFAPPLSDIAKLQFAGGYGLGSGTVADAQNVKPPSNSANRGAQRAARAQLEELAPLENIEPLAGLPNLPPQAKEFGKIGAGLLDRAGKSADWSALMEVLDDFRMYMEAGGDKFNTNLNNKILDMLTEKTKALLEKNRQDCLSADEMKAQEMGRRLNAPKSSLDRALAERFKKKFGDKLVKDLLAGFKGCNFSLDVYSNLTFEAEKTTLFVTMKTETFPLWMVYSKGDTYLYGSGFFTLDMRIVGQGCNSPLKQYDRLELYIDRLTPIYDGSTLKDFSLEMSVGGWKAANGAKGEGEKCPNYIELLGGGDYWTGLFTISRITHMDHFMHGWKISGGPLNKKVPLTAKWEAADLNFSPLGGDAKMSESSRFTLRVTPRK